MSIISKEDLTLKEELIWKLFEMGHIEMSDVVILEEYAEDEDEDDFTGILSYIGFEVQE